MNVQFDRPEAGQWGFGIVSWPVEDAAAKREIVIMFLFWSLIITVNK